MWPIQKTFSTPAYGQNMYLKNTIKWYIFISGLPKPKIFSFSGNMNSKVFPELCISRGDQNSWRYAKFCPFWTQTDKNWLFSAYFGHFWHFLPFLAKLAKNICIYDNKKALLNINHYMWVILYGLMKSHVALMVPTHTPTSP